MAVTIRQIAAAAGVSRGTVDRVLHNRPGVRPEIAEHIRAIANEMGFQPNRAGRILAARKQPITIGCFMPSIGNPFFEDVVRGFRQAENEFKDFGISVCIKQIKGFDAKEHMEAIQGLVDEGCGALCISTIDIKPIRQFVDGLVDSGIPVITFNTDLSHTKRLCYVGSDYFKSGATAAGLLTLTFRDKLNLMIVTGSLKMKGHNDRIRGFSRTLRKNSVPYHLVDVFESQDNDEHAYQSALRVLQEHPEINCVYLVAAGVAGVCKAVQELGIAQEIRIISHDDIPATRQLIEEGVIDATVCQEPVQQGYKAVQILFDYFVDNKQTTPEDFITGTVIKIKENL